MVTFNADNTGGWGCAYTPTQAARAHAAATLKEETDSFRVGFSDGTATTTVTVTVPIAPATNQPPVNHAPTPTVTRVGRVDPNTGTVTYRVVAADPDLGDVVRLAVADAPDRGGLKFSLNGSLTYTPIPAARLQAGAPNAMPADQQDTFTLTATDGATITVSVTAPITPSNTVATIDVGDKRAR